MTKIMQQLLKFWRSRNNKIYSFNIFQTKMKKILFILLFFFSANFTFAQNNFSSHTLFSSVGFTVAQTDVVSFGIGTSFGLGYQRNIFSKFTTRLRFVPSLTFGGYKGTHAHFPDAHYSSYNLKTNFNFDVLRIKSFSFFIGTGITLNYMNGYVGSGGYPNYMNDGNFIEEKKNYYFDASNFAINGLFGFQLNPKNNRLGYELKVLDFSVVPNNRGNVIEFTPIAFRLLFKLKKSD